jgi:hypothetical protein
MKEMAKIICGYRAVGENYNSPLDNQKRCKEVCSDAEYDMLERAFFDKESNLRK